MDRNTIIRWAVIAALVFVFMKWGLPMFTGKGGDHKEQPIPAEHYADAPDFVPDVIDDGKSQPPEGEICTIKTDLFRAELSTRGAAVKHFWLLDRQYATSAAADLSTTPDQERWRSLRTLFRGEGADDQVKYDRFNWSLERIGQDAGCKFTYEDDGVRIVKTISVGVRPYELKVSTSVTNLTDAPKKHRFSIASFAYRTNKETKGSLGRISPFVTELSCAREKDVVRKSKTDFKEGWFSEPLVDRYAAVSNAYFAQAMVPEGAPNGAKPACDLLAEQWYAEGQKPDDDEAGDVYHALLTYPAQSLAHGETATYDQIAFYGPKERTILSHAAGGGPRLGDLIDLGFFSPIAKILVLLLTWISAHVTFGNWGVAIIVMTLAVRVILFPITFKGLKSIVAMRKLKPEMDQVTAKFKDDMQARNLAMMELYRKHKVSPFGGCLPQLIQMPVWWAMWRTLQTAAELFNVRFLWFKDLSAPDPFFVLPVVLGILMIVQQRIVPQQGMDPMQQKLMMWLIPIIFSGMYLFLPAALALYSLTNSVVAIVQQLVMEKLAPRGGSGTKSGEIVVKPISEFGKGKARV